MSAIVGAATCRRSFLVGAAGLLVAGTFPRASAESSKPPGQFALTAAKGRASLVGKAHPATGVWCYGGTIPGPIIRARQGEPIRIVVDNNLSEETTVHWHGIRLPIGMDGVPGISQPPIAPGQRFTYEFTPPDAGTFWYHPHADSLQQLGRGMAGALIVDEPGPIAVDRDVLWMLTDWRLTADAQIASGFGNSMDAAMSGRVGNTVTVNGAVSKEERVRAGERVRLRLVNSSLARIMALRFEQHRPLIIAIDGQPCDPHEPDGGRLLLGPAMRIDLLLDMQGKPGRRYRVIDDFYDGLAYWVTKLAYEDKPPLRAHSLDPPPALPRNPVPEPDVTTAQRQELRLQGGMMGGGGMAGMGGMSDMSHAAWAINGTSMTGDGHAGMAPLLTLQLGRSYLFTLRNDTAWWHPMHLHGHSFRVLSRNGRPVPRQQWADTVLVPPRETVDIAFVADNPGDWMLHCHVTDHQVSGMMAILRIV
ncbi:MAG: multicopper oxidase family protein [Bradyrhizobiaceae bacterium]|nr:MAG: multicopper oxidase family protein [Bradyrhizobiaceae bacterium]